jgi:hypothetical protein
MANSEMDTLANRANRALLTGVLDSQYGSDQMITHRVIRDGAQGLSIRIMLQLPGIYAGSYALPIEITPGMPGSDLIAQLAIGDRISVGASLAWREWPDPRFPMGTGYQRRIKQLVIHSADLQRSDPQTPLGSEIQLCGTTLGSAQVVRHPVHRNLTLAITTLRVETPRRQLADRSWITSVEHIPVAISAQHPGAPSLLRAGNRVHIHGTIDRYSVQLHGPDVEQALAVLDTDWQRRLAGMADATMRAQEEQRYLRKRRQLRIGHYSRVVAGSIVLMEGEPLPLRDAQRRREGKLAQRRQERRSAEFNNM